MNSMIDYTKLDMICMDEVIASIDLKPLSGRMPHVMNG